MIRLLRLRLPALAAVLILLGASCLTTFARAEQDPYTAFSDLLAKKADASHAKVLSPEDVALWHEIFAAGEAGDWAAADRAYAKTSNKLLRGHMLFQRYMHPTAYTSTYEELKDWLALYNDLPGAYRIYKLARRKNPGGEGALQRPERRHYRREVNRIQVPEFDMRNKSHASRRRVTEINRYVRSLLARERPTQSLNYISQARVRNDLTPAEFDRLKSWIAAQYFFERVPEKAYRVATEVLKTHRTILPLADWVAGLSAWQMKNYEAAAEHFEYYAGAKYLEPGQQAAGAYWAARANLVAKHPEKVVPLLERAATDKYSFYGVLAARQLGKKDVYNWKPPEITPEGLKAVTAEPGVARAIALAQLGLRSLAREELTRAHGKMDASHDLDLLAIASALDLPNAQLQIAEYAPGKTEKDGSAFDAGRYPIPACYTPKNGFKVDRALLYAFMRKESKFDPDATSWVGARGLMQLMPHTASFLAKDSSLARHNRDKLYDPGFNLSLGQTYLRRLMTMGKPDGNLFMVTVAYNGGPGNLKKWEGELSKDNAADPLFFIESIPARETRAFIEQVLTNLWIYRDRLGQDAPTLDMTASGKWPVYQSQEAPRIGSLALN